MQKLLRQVLTIPIVLYQWIISPFFPSHCNYHPTCSEYTRQAIQRHGLIRGLTMGLMRIGRCSARFAGGSDPVPDRFVLNELVDEYRSRSTRRSAQHTTNQSAAERDSDRADT